MEAGFLTKRAVVGDFGLATKIPDPSREIQLSIVGSPYWMAPECIQAQPYNEIVSSPGFLEIPLWSRYDTFVSVS